MATSLTNHNNVTIPPQETHPRSERAQTDESLRVEREKVDHALAEDVTSTDETADAVISRARERADALLATARSKVDQQAACAPANVPSSKTVARERGREDQELRAERAEADEAVLEARAELAAQLLVERQETDRDLSLERAQSDDVVATRDEFLGIVGHELGNMLTAMGGSAALIAIEVARENHVESILAHTQRIQRSAGRMNRLIGDLLDLASIQAGVLAVTRELGDPASVVTEAVDTFQARAAAGGVSLVGEIQAPLSVSFDPARILQVLTNLLSNAIKFTPPGGHIVVRAEQIGDDVRFAVSDTGTGIPADRLQAVFVRFHQVSKNDRRGLGLGLYISKCIVESHGGRIWAESKIDEGSTFYFTIPMLVER